MEKVDVPQEQKKKKRGFGRRILEGTRDATSAAGRGIWDRRTTIIRIGVGIAVPIGLALLGAAAQTLGGVAVGEIIGIL